MYYYFHVQFRENNNICIIRENNNICIIRVEKSQINQQEAEEKIIGVIIRRLQHEFSPVLGITSVEVKRSDFEIKEFTLEDLVSCIKFVDDIAELSIFQVNMNQ